MTASWRQARPRRRWLLPCLILATVVVVELAFPRLLMPSATLGQYRIIPRELSWSAPKPPSLDAYPDAVARPLYSPTRSPGDSALAVADGPPSGDGPVSSLALAGIVTSGKVRLAIFRGAGPGDTQRLREGAAIGGWDIERILVDRVILSRDGRSQELLLNDPAKSDS